MTPQEIIDAYNSEYLTLLQAEEMLQEQGFSYDQILDMLIPVEQEEEDDDASFNWFDY